MLKNCETEKAQRSSSYERSSCQSEKRIVLKQWKVGKVFCIQAVEGKQDIVFKP